MMITNFSRNPVLVNCMSANALQANFRFELEIFLKEINGSAYESLVTLKGVPDATGSYIFNIQKILHAFLAPDLPAFNQNYISKGGQVFRTYKTKINEMFGFPVATVQSSVETAPELVLQGGMSFLDFPAHTFFQQNLEAEGNFMTIQPDGKLVQPGQQEYLYYYTVNQGYIQLFLHAEVVYDDGSTTQMNPLSLVGATDSMVILPVGFTQLGLAGINPAKSVRKYSVFVSKSGDPDSLNGKSKTRTYQVDYRYHKHLRYFLYANSLGGMETLAATGKFEQMVEVFTLEGESIVPPNYDAAATSSFNYSTSYRDIYKANTGHIDVAQKKHLKEFIISENKYEIFDGRFVKIRTKFSKEALAKDFRYVDALEFEYSYAHENQAYS